MKKTITEINKQLIGKRLCLLWQDVRIIVHVVYLLFLIFSVPLLTVWFAKSNLVILGWLGLFMIYYNFCMLSKILSPLTDEYEAIKSKRNELRAIIYEKVCLKKTLKLKFKGRN